MTVLPARGCGLLFAGLVALAACAGDDALDHAADETAAAVQPCGVLRPAADSARPFSWIGVSGIPAGFGPAVAEIDAEGISEPLVAPVAVHPDGTAELRVPVHPSFRLAGGEVRVRIAAADNSCEPFPLHIAALPAAPGAMAAAAAELRVVVDDILSSGGAAPLAGLASDDPGAIAWRGGEIGLFAVPALWTLPELVELEGLLSEPAPPGGDAEMLDAIAGRLALAERMQEFRALVLVADRLAGDVTVTLPAVEAWLPGAPSAASDNRSASVLGPLVSTGQRLATGLMALGRPAGGEDPTVRLVDQCPTDVRNLFAIAEPAKLDDLMRVQGYARRFAAGAGDAAGGSASGTVFGDLGEVAGVIGMLGKQGEAAAAVWDAFSTVVLNTADAYMNLLPGDMELILEAAPREFPEDSEQRGRWTARAVASSEGMKLTKEVIEKVMEKALEAGLAEASVGNPLTETLAENLPDDVKDLRNEAAKKAWKDVGEKVAGKIDEEAIEKPTSAALKALLDEIGAKEGPDGFDIPPGCWALADMSASDAGKVSSDARVGGGSPPPLITAHLSGDAVVFRGNGPAPREFEPAKAGESRLEVRTAADYRKSIELPGGLSIATTYAFGGNQYVATLPLKVWKIEVEIFPSVHRIEAGEPQAFVATVDNAIDKSVTWSASAGTLVDIRDYGDGQHEATLLTPTDPAAYPLEVEVESATRTGPRSSGLPERKATGRLYIGDPVVAVIPTRGCLDAGGERHYAATLIGVPDGEVRWEATGGRIVPEDATSALYRAPRAPGSYEITAIYTRDEEIRNTVTVEVGQHCCLFTATMSAGEYAGSHTGPAVLMGNLMSLKDPDTNWSARVHLPNADETQGPRSDRPAWRGIAPQAGEYPSDLMALVAKVPLVGPKWGNKNPPDTAVVMGGLLQDSPDTWATAHITRVEDDPGTLASPEGFVEGRVEARVAWRVELNTFDFADVRIQFRAIPAKPSESDPRGAYTQCLNSWGRQSPYQRMRDKLQSP